MTFCRNCRKFNAGEPMRCRYCRAGLAGRLCPRGHVNPVDAGLSFCGECGQPLERTWGAGSSHVRLLVVGLAAIALVALIAAIVASPSLQTQAFGMLIILALLIGGLRLAFGMVPAKERAFVGALLKGCINLLTGTGNKGKK